VLSAVKVEQHPVTQGAAELSRWATEQRTQWVSETQLAARHGMHAVPVPLEANGVASTETPTSGNSAV
jgi:hypothetical protein